MPTRPAALRFRDPTYAAKLGDQFAGGMVAPIGGVFEAENIPLIEKMMGMVRQASKEEIPDITVEKLLDMPGAFEKGPKGTPITLQEMLEDSYRVMGAYLKQAHGMTPEQIASENFKFQMPHVPMSGKVSIGRPGFADRTIRGYIGSTMDGVQFLLDRLAELRAKK